MYLGVEVPAGQREKYRKICKRQIGQMIGLLNDPQNEGIAVDLVRRIEALTRWLKAMP